MTSGVVITGITSLAFGALGTYFGMTANATKDILLRSKEPLLISTDREHTQYMLPPGTVFRYIDSMAEGPELFTIDVMVNGRFEAEKLEPGTKAEKLSVWIIDDREYIKRLINNYPMSKDDIVKLLKARKITRDELAQIVRDWRD